MKFHKEGEDPGTVEPLGRPPVPPTPVLDVGSGKTPEEEPVMNPVLQEIVTAVALVRFAMLYT